MSILRDSDERAAALAKLANATDEQLRADLEYWSVASRDHVVETRELVNRQLLLGDLYQEEEAWVALITDEVRRRRARARQAVPS